MCIEHFRAKLSGAVIFVLWGTATWSVQALGNSQKPQVSGAQNSATPVQTIQAAPIEINASAPKPDPDPYALPPKAPESLVKLRTDMEKWYQDYKELTVMLIKGLEIKDFEKFGIGAGGPEFKMASPSIGADGSAGSPNVEEIMKRLEHLTRLIEMSQAEFLQEKEVFLTHGRMNQGPGSVTVQSQNMTQVQVQSK